MRTIGVWWPVPKLQIGTKLGQWGGQKHKIWPGWFQVKRGWVLSRFTASLTLSHVCTCSHVSSFFFFFYLLFNRLTFFFTYITGLVRSNDKVGTSRGGLMRVAPYSRFMRPPPVHQDRNLSYHPPNENHPREHNQSHNNQRHNTRIHNQTQNTRFNRPNQLPSAPVHHDFSRDRMMQMIQGE